MKKDTVKIIALTLMTVAVVAFLCEKIVVDTQAHHQEYLECLENNTTRVCDNIYYR